MSLPDDPEVIAIDQRSFEAHQALSSGGTVVWLSRPRAATPSGREDWYLAVFNLRPAARTIDVSWSALSLAGRRHARRDLWTRRNVGSATLLRVRLDAHGAALYRLHPDGGSRLR